MTFTEKYTSSKIYICTYLLSLGSNMEIYTCKCKYVMKIKVKVDVGTKLFERNDADQLHVTYVYVFLL